MALSSLLSSLHRVVLARVPRFMRSLAQGRHEAMVFSISKAANAAQEVELIAQYIEVEESLPVG